uniref:Uncharacterized protein n=1 Tax=Glossina pallidipes TaxID=7398 RepID=A0A1B0A8B4_GLOPL
MRSADCSSLVLVFLGSPALLGFLKVKYTKISQFAKWTHLRQWLDRSFMGKEENATTASWGSSGSGASNKTCSDNRTVRKVMAAAQLSFKISKQMAPVADDIFGCQTLVMKRTLGGAKGYLSGTYSSREVKVLSNQEAGDYGKATQL